MNVTKKMVSDCFKNLEKKFNYLVKNFNGNRQIKFGAFTGFIDHLIISHTGVIFFIETKLYKDDLKPEQEKLKRLSYFSFGVSPFSNSIINFS